MSSSNPSKPFLSESHQKPFSEPLKALLQRDHLLEVEPRRLDNQVELGIVLSISNHVYALLGGGLVGDGLVGDVLVGDGLVGDLGRNEQRLRLADF